MTANQHLEGRNKIIRNKTELRAGICTGLEKGQRSVPEPILCGPLPAVAPSPGDSRICRHLHAHMHISTHKHIHIHIIKTHILNILQDKFR